MANTSPLVALSSVGRLDLLRGACSQVWVPEAVYRETVLHGDGWVQAAQLQKKFGLERG